MANVQDCGLELSEFELQSRYYVHFQSNTPRKSKSPLILRSYGLNNVTVLLHTIV